MCPDPSLSRGPLHTAFLEAANGMWRGKRSELQCRSQAYGLLHFFEKRFVSYGADRPPSMDDIQTAWIEDFKSEKLHDGLSPSTINSYLSVLKQINQYALRRNPPLASKELHIKFLARPKVEQWWLNDDDMKLVGAYCTVKAEEGDEGNYRWRDLWLLIQIMVYNGLRVEEALRLENRHIVGWNTNQTAIKVPGTKTVGSEASIPMFKDTRGAFEDYMSYFGGFFGDDGFFPESYDVFRPMWNEIREYLGVSHLPTSTLRALRRTFAYRANRAGMPTRTLQKVLRHGSIQTTERYLTLVGADEAEQARNYL